MCKPEYVGHINHSLWASQRHGEFSWVNYLVSVIMEGIVDHLIQRDSRSIFQTVGEGFFRYRGRGILISSETLGWYLATVRNGWSSKSPGLWGLRFAQWFVKKRFSREILRVGECVRRDFLRRRRRIYNCRLLTRYLQFYTFSALSLSLSFNFGASRVVYGPSPGDLICRKYRKPYDFWYGNGPNAFPQVHWYISS